MHRLNAELLNEREVAPGAGAWRAVAMRRAQALPGGVPPARLCTCAVQEGGREPKVAT